MARISPMIAFLRQLWTFIRPYRARFFLGVGFGIVSGLIEPLMIATIAFVYGVVFPSANQTPLSAQSSWLPAGLREAANSVQQSLSTGVQAHPGAILLVVSLIPLILFLRGLFSYLNVYCLQWTATRAVTDLRVRLFNHLIRLSAGFFNRSQTGELMSRLMNDTGALQNVISQSAATMVKDPVTLLALLGYLLWQQPMLTLISLVVLPATIVPITIQSRRIRRASRGMQSEMADLGGTMSETFTGIRVIQAYNLEPTVVEHFRASSGKFVGHFMRAVRSSEIPGPLMEFAGSIGVSAIIVFIALKGGMKTTSGDFLKFILAMFSMYRPMKSLTRLHNSIEQARSASERVFELLATKSDIVEPVQAKLVHAAGAEIRFENLNFSFGEKRVLQNINLTVQSGQMVALVGTSGSGKTTLTNLLLRFYDPQQGSVRIGDTDLREFATRDLRNQIAVVTQENILFNDTVRRNIELGRPGASQTDIEMAARQAHAYEFIMQKPEGFDTVVGEKGVSLSGGQRQRLAIARAVLKNAPILILDEATSALDTESERAVQSALDELMKGRTSFCIAHRLSTILHADMIVVLDQGKIVETGRHEELVKRGGIYQKLYELQFAA